MKKINLPNLDMNEQSLNGAEIIKSVFISYGLSIFLLALFAVILTYTSVPESYISNVVFIISIVSILYAGKIATKKVKSRGWLIGSITGIVYMLILYLLSLIFTKRPVFDMHVLFIFAMGFLAGAIGGIFGINLRKQEKRYK